MHLIRFASAALVLMIVGTQSTLADCAEPTEVQQLGTLAVDEYKALVLFQDPADDGKSYRICVAIPKPWDTPSISTKRMDVWLLARGGQALKVNLRPVGEALIEAGSIGATANAIYFFDRSVERGELTAVVISVDGMPKAFQIKHSD